MSASYRAKGLKFSPDGNVFSKLVNYTETIDLQTNLKIVCG